MKWLKDNGRKPSTKDASVIMSNPVDIAQLAMLFGENIPTQLLHEINDDLLFELSTIELYKDTISTLQILKEHGFKIALCSNLAMPYGEQLKSCFHMYLMHFLSYEIGAIKPEDYIYEVIKTHFNCEMSEMLFIGDHPVLDVENPFL